MPTQTPEPVLQTMPSDPTVELQAYTPPPFPTWPPPSGGAPVTAWEMGPITNPYPYGSTQTANISIAGPAPVKNATKYPQKMPTGASGQNQQPPAGWPTWPHSRVNVLPDKANPAISQISPPPLMGPAPQGAQMANWETATDPGVPFPPNRWPPRTPGYIDGLGTTVTPTRIVGGLGN
jgi:hypothetical protein